MTYTIAVCKVKNSWWWTEELSETCRVLFQNKFEKFCTSSWFSYKKKQKLWKKRLKESSRRTIMLFLATNQKWFCYFCRIVWGTAGKRWPNTAKRQITRTLFNGRYNMSVHTNGGELRTTCSNHRIPPYSSRTAPIHQYTPKQSSTPTHSHQILRMNVITFETCWAIKSFHKMTSSWFNLFN